ECLVVLHAVGARMQFEGDLPATDLIALVRRAQPATVETPSLPEPLAEPAFEVHIDRATAQAYEVRAGQYIQVIDVAGRQCSDFLAFDARQLRHGRERG